MPALSESSSAQSRLDSLLLGCYTAQKLYGRDPGSLESVNEVFHHVLGRHPADQVINAFTIWIERSQEFPTPADIVGLIRRGGLPPLSKEMYIAISRKDAEARTADDWAYLRDYEAEQRGEHSGFRDEAKEAATLEENARLRIEVKRLREEVARLAALLHEARLAKGAEAPRPSAREKAERTIEAMRAGGASEEDIGEFARQQGIRASSTGPGRRAATASSSNGSAISHRPSTAGWTTTPTPG